MEERLVPLILVIAGLLVIFFTFIWTTFLLQDTTATDVDDVSHNAWTNSSDINVLDIQFSESNRPLVIYRDMFTKGAPWIGGYDIGIGKTIIPKRERKNM